MNGQGRSAQHLLMRNMQAGRQHGMHPPNNVGTYNNA
jgi:hypothetical protein